MREWRFFGVSALVFAVSAAVTIAWCTSMTAMGGMPMPGGWTMSMTWMRMPEQTWLGAAASFLAMWVVMMVAMMLPAVTPVLWRYHEGAASMGRRRVGTLAAAVGTGYFSAWAVLGAIVFPIGIVLATFAMAQPEVARAVPSAIGLVVLTAGTIQFTGWKRGQLACCRQAFGRTHTFSASLGPAWYHGVRLGLQCAPCCANLMAILLVLGVMDLRVMAVVTTAITIERLASSGWHAERAIGAVLVAGGMFLLVG